MSSFLSENFIKIVSLIIATVAILGSLVQFASFQADVRGYGYERQYMIFSQDIIGAKFFSYEISGEVVKGVFSKNKLDSLTTTTNPNGDGGYGNLGGKINFAPLQKYFINVTVDEKNFWEFGDRTLLDENFVRYYYPIAIKYPNKTVPAIVYVFVPRVG